MAHDVFISHSTKDKKVADAVCAALEADHIRCWVAPRDVPPGAEWAASIVGAIRASRVMIIIFSKHSSDSGHVRRELTVAVEAGAVVVPMKIDDTPLGGVMEYYLSDTHWLDAMNPPSREQIARLVDTVRPIVAVTDGGVSDPPREHEPSTEFERAKEQSEGAPRGRMKPLIAAAVALAVVAAGVGVWLTFRSAPDPDTVASAGGSPPTASDDTSDEPPAEPADTRDWGEWRTLTFSTTQEDLWTQTADDSYTAIDQQDETAWLWSDETFEGDVIFGCDVSTPGPIGSAIVLLYGDGLEFTHGNLIFAMEKIHYIAKHDTFSETNFLYAADGIPDMSTETHEMRVEAIDDQVSLYVDGIRACSSHISPEDEIVRSGRIALSKWWECSGVTYSNIRVRTRE